MYDSDMIVSTVFLAEIMSVLMPLATSLQERGGDICKAVQSVQVIADVVQDSRDDFSKVWQKVIIRTYILSNEVNVQCKLISFTCSCVYTATDQWPPSNKNCFRLRNWHWNCTLRWPSRVSLAVSATGPMYPPSPRLSTSGSTSSCHWWMLSWLSSRADSVQPCSWPVS